MFQIQFKKKTSTLHYTQYLSQDLRVPSYNQYIIPKIPKFQIEKREKLPTFSEIISKKGVQERWIGTYKWHRLGGSRQHMGHQQGKHRL